MLLEFKCSNHKSIKEQITFSMIASSDKSNEEFLKKCDNYNVLRSTVIYGPNGSGKSNFIDALCFIKNLVSNSINHQPGQGIFQSPHKLSSSLDPSEYKIQFIKDDIRFAYGFSIVQNKVKNEYLHYFPCGRQKMIFERYDLNVSTNDEFKKSFELSKSALKDNRLFLSCAANFSDVSIIEKAFSFFMDDMIFYNPTNNNWIEYSIDLMQNNSNIKKTFVDILKYLGTGIEDVDVKLEKVNFEDLSKEIPVPTQIKELFGNQQVNKFEAKVHYEKFSVDLIHEESTGVKKLFEIICPIIDILNKGKILICDEFESSLHEAVVYSIVNIFHQFRKDKFAQLIFTTHDTSLLDSKLFRRDQVWFTQLTDNRTTDLYSLVEIRNVRKTENLERGYILGKYGALPMISKNVNKLLAEE